MTTRQYTSHQAVSLDAVEGSGGEALRRVAITAVDTLFDALPTQGLIAPESLTLGVSVADPDLPAILLVRARVNFVTKEATPEARLVETLADAHREGRAR